MTNKKEVFPTLLVMFGATGDLARRKLVPALWYLYKEGWLPESWQVVGVARSKMGEKEYRNWIKEVVSGSAVLPEKGELLDNFCKRFTYQTGLFEELAAYREVGKKLGRWDHEWHLCANKLFYLAVPPQYYKTIFQNLADSGLTEPCSEEEGWTRLAVEKPFGKDLSTAQELDSLLGKLFREEQIYRVDHYLGKDTVRNILAFRFSNSFLEPAWNNRWISKIRVYLPETIEVKGRGAFYDGIGELRDMGQNHMLQALALMTMENPSRFDAETIRSKRAEVLQALEIMDERDIVERTARGQYRGYLGVEGVNGKSSTETYFRIETEIQSARWRSVPIILESGKAMNESKFELTVDFRHKTPCLCPKGEGKHFTNSLRYRVQPDEGIATSFWVKKPGPEMVIEEKEFSFDYKESYKGDHFIEAYAKLLQDAIAGDQTLFVSTPEIEASWRFVDPIIRAWQNSAVPLERYAVGTGRVSVKGQKEIASKKEVGYIGLGKMGLNMVERLLERDWRVVATDRDSKLLDKVQSVGAAIAPSAAEAVKQLAAPRLVWIMVPYQAVDDVLREIAPELRAGDVVIDGGNSFYKDSAARASALSKKGIVFLDVGVSGGPSGARDGACLMIGGDEQTYKKYAGLFGDLATAAGFDYMGKSGAGHFVKMVHNGIEYGMMQALGEGFTVMKESDFNLDLEKIAGLFNHGSVVESRLVGWLKDAYEEYGLGLTEVSGKVAHSGEGQWTTEVAKELDVPVPIIKGALKFRIDSQQAPSYIGQVVSALRNKFGGHEVKRLE